MKNIVGTAKAWIASQRNVNIGYATGWFIFFTTFSSLFFIMI
jgi:hypothetical protein